MSYGYLVVEGPHEVEFIGKFLKRFGFRRIIRIEDLNPFWKKIVPTTFPYAGDLKKRMPVPDFFHKDNYSIAIHSAEGVDQIVKTINGTLNNYDQFLEVVAGIGIIIDADHSNDSGRAKFKKIKAELKGIMDLPQNPGEIIEQEIKAGFYIFPDNSSDGTLERILIDCATTNYNELYNGALEYINNVSVENLNKSERKDFIKPSGKDKAVVGCIGNILRPGKAIQVSIQDNRWVDENTIGIHEMSLFNEFLKNLFELES